MSSPHRLRLSLVRAFLLAGATGSIAAFAPAAADMTSYAFVNDDGTLELRRRTIHLFGIHIPETERSCRTNVRPVECGPRAVLALKFKIWGNFVSCEERERNPDRSIVAVCRVDGEDLSAYLLKMGWAVALPDAPIEYQAQEKIARARGLGVWGFSVEPIRR